MSGGSYNYLYYKVEEMGEQLAGQKDPLRVAFGKHLQLVAKAMHDVEWVDSRDYGQGDDHKAIEAVLGASTKQLALDVLIERAKELTEQLDSAIFRAKEDTK